MVNVLFYFVGIASKINKKHLYIKIFNQHQYSRVLKLNFYKWRAMLSCTIHFIGY